MHVLSKRVSCDVTLEGMTVVLIVEGVLLHELDSPGGEVTGVEEQGLVFLQQGKQEIADAASHF